MTDGSVIMVAIGALDAAESAVTGERAKIAVREARARLAVAVAAPMEEPDDFVPVQVLRRELRKSARTARRWSKACPGAHMRGRLKYVSRSWCLSQARERANGTLNG